jgi:two-component system response regulator (stage 0 sporulation protein F)
MNVGRGIIAACASHHARIRNGIMASIIIIDDQDQVRALLAAILDGDGHNVFEADNGSIGIELYRKHLPDVVITDIFMPDPDGLAFMGALMKEFPEAKVIAMTGGSGEQEILNVAKVLGARQILLKPFTVQQVRDAVHSAIQARSLE